MTQKTPCLTQNNTTLTQRKPTRSPQTRKEDHTSIFTNLRQKNVKHHTPQKITILSPVYIKEYQCTNMYIKKNNNYMNYIFIISSINTHTPIYKKIIYNISYKMLIKKIKHHQPHTPQGGYSRANPIIKKQQYTTTPKNTQTTHRPIPAVLYYPRDFIKYFYGFFG